MSKHKTIPRLIRAATAGAIGLAAAGALAAFAGPAHAADLPGTAGAAPPTVFVQTDNPAGNQVIALAQRPGGQLFQEQVLSTGGLGGIEAATPAGFGGLASQGSLAYDPGHHLLFAVNAGSDTISVLSVDGRHVRLDQVLSSRGEFPNSIAVHGNLVYVANAGGAGSVSGFSIFGQYVVPLPGSTRSLGLDSTNPPRSCWSPPSCPPTRSTSSGSVHLGISRQRRPSPPMTATARSRSLSHPPVSWR
jgi:hypothetical protein